MSWCRASVRVVVSKISTEAYYRENRNMSFIMEHNIVKSFQDCIFSLHEHKMSSSTWICGWFIALFLMYCAAYNVLKEVTMIMISKKCIPKLNQIRLINALWRLKFCCLCFLVYKQQLFRAEMHSFSSVISLISELFSVVSCRSSKIHATADEESQALDVLLYYIVPISFFIHQIYLLLHNPEAPHPLPVVFLLFFLQATYSLRCWDLSVKVLSLIAVTEGSMEVARVCLALKSRCKGSNAPTASSFFEVLILPLFTLHIFIRAVVAVYLFPTLVFFLPSLIEAEKSSLLPTAYVNLFLCLYFPWQILYSPIWCLLEIIVKRKTRRPLKVWCIPSLVLLPYSSSLLYELREIQLDFLKNVPLSSAEIRTMRRNILSQNKAPSQSSQSQVTDNAGGLLSVVKCMIALKKKMRHRYEMKNALEPQLSQSPSIELQDQDDSHSSAFSHEGSMSTTEDVTDIFIAVPNISCTSVTEARFVQENQNTEVLVTQPIEDKEIPSVNLNDHNPIAEESETLHQSNENSHEIESVTEICENGNKK